ncbi:hypothetical protein [Pontibacter pamirensis]|nr:hypothetical protein [Pontibacter pamirensis]
MSEEQKKAAPFDVERLFSVVDLSIELSNLINKDFEAEDKYLQMGEGQ